MHLRSIFVLVATAATLVVPAALAATGKTTFTFVTEGIEHAIEQGSAAAGDKLCETRRRLDVDDQSRLLE